MTKAPIIRICSDLKIHLRDELEDHQESNSAEEVRETIDNLSVSADCSAERMTAGDEKKLLTTAA